MSAVQIHGTCVAFEAGAVILRGPSGAGKSDLAYRLISEQGGKLVADDQVVLHSQDDALLAQARPDWQGLLELRGLGLVTQPVVHQAQVKLLVDLVGRGQVPRLPQPCFEELSGHSLPALRLHAFDVTTAAKVRLAVMHIPEKNTDGRRTGGFAGDDGRID